MAVVISLGGSMVNPDGIPDAKFLKKMKALLKGKEKIGIVVGGGKIAREYVKAASDFSKAQFWLDTMAIKATRLNAALVAQALGEEACPSVFEDFEKAAQASRQYKIVVMGGTVPGITTDTDSVLLAEAIGAKRVLNVSIVDGVYDSNPKTNPKAKKFGKLTYEKLLTLANESDKRTAGTNFVFDVVACKLAARSKLELHFVGEKNINEVPKALSGKAHKGTIVK
ncbi:UMP kinase [Candidatus Micrarchaeota archaeon]|nr:UMP kinase [Candidatus Micrarchaeota archaeon]